VFFWTGHLTRRALCLRATGETYLYWLRRRPALYVSDPELIREIGRCVSLDLGKPTYLQKGQEPLFGRGVLKANGAEWHHQRKLIAPEFYMAKVKVNPAAAAARPTRFLETCACAC
jgi:cytochrome P450